MSELTQGKYIPAKCCMCGSKTTEESEWIVKGFGVVCDRCLVDSLRLAQQSLDGARAIVALYGNRGETA